MRLPDYDRLIARLEALAAESPAIYRLRLGLLAALGFAAMGMVLLAGLAMLALGIWILVFQNTSARGRGDGGAIKGGIVLITIGGLVCWSVLRASWVRLPPPDGLVATRQGAPSLWSVVEELCRGTGSPLPHRIIISADLNAALVQRPLLGLLGWYRNELVLGLPLLRLLSPPQALSVLAHELGHLAHQHGRFAITMHRLRSIWAAIHQRLHGSGQGKVVGWFLRWYAPRFSAWSFVLARMHEREADLCAERAAGRQAAGEALLRIHCLARLAEETFWPALERSTAQQQEPPPDLLTRLDHALRELPPEGRRWQTEALNLRSDRDDPHPALRDRLALLGWADPDGLRGSLPPGPPATSAARAWLAESEAALAEGLSTTWKKQVAANWAQRHVLAQSQVARRRELEAKTTAERSLEERWELAQLLLLLDGDQDSLPALESVLELDRDHPGALFHCGRLLLQADDARGVVLVERAIQLDRGIEPAGLALLRLFHARHGDQGRLEGAEQRAVVRAEEEEKAALERSRLPDPKKLRPHGLQPDVLAPVSALLASFPEVGAADCARVEVEHLPEQPWFVLAIRVQAPWWKPRASDADAKLLNAIIAAGLPLPGTYLLITASGQTAGLAKRIARIAGARIHPRTAA